ncbi:MAG: MOSC N-terminal beta barrel domain-containing protein [Acidimicrobiales bacterium]
MTETVGTVKTLSRFPVKSMQGEKLASAEVTANGLVGDRAYALVETETGKVLSGKTPRLGPQLLSCRAEFVEAPASGAEPPPVRITLPDGTAVTSDARNANATISAFLGREVTLQRAAPENFTIDHYHPDIEGLGPEEHRDTTTETKLGRAFFAQAGMPSPVAVGSFFDLFPASVLTTSTLAQLQSLRPESRFDERRFRMNVVVDTTEDGFVENGWLGHSLQIGDTVRLAVLLSDPRCVMTTLAQDELPKDNEILKALVRHNKLDVAGGRYPCAGVYAVVEAAGTISAGDSVSLI